jgi:hypothetical protein
MLSFRQKNVTYLSHIVYLLHTSDITNKVRVTSVPLATERPVHARRRRRQFHSSLPICQRNICHSLTFGRYVVVWWSRVHVCPRVRHRAVTRNERGAGTTTSSYWEYRYYRPKAIQMRCDCNKNREKAFVVLLLNGSMRG